MVPPVGGSASWLVTVVESLFRLYGTHGIYPMLQYSQSSLCDRLTHSAIIFFRIKKSRKEDFGIPRLAVEVMSSETEN